MKSRFLARCLAIMMTFAMVFTGLPLMAGGLDSYAASAKRPAKVKSLSVSLTSANKVKLKWSKVKKITKGYAIYRNGKIIARVSRSKTSYTDTKVKPGTSYKYYVKAFNKTKAKRWYNKKTKKYQKKKPPKKYRGKQKKVTVYTYGKKSVTRKIKTKSTPAPDPGKDYSYSEGEDGTLTLTSYNGNGGEVKIPSEIDGKKVTQIGDSCFRGDAYVKSVVIPDSVTAIGDYAFEACGAMTAVKFSSMLKSIGKGAFSGCAKLSSVSIPEGVEVIDEGAFLYCMGVTKMTLPSSIRQLGQFAFAGMETLVFADMTLSNPVAIPDRLFCNCKALNEVKISGATSIGKRAFSGCDSLQKVDLGDTVADVGDYAFEKCYILKDVHIHGSEIKLGSNVFKEVGEDSKDVAGVFSFEGNVTFAPDTFADTSFKELKLSEGSSLYLLEDGQKSLCTVGEGMIIADEGRKLLMVFYSAIENGTCVLPEGIERIYGGAFSNLTFDSLTLPESISEISESAFFKCILGEISLGNENENDNFFIRDNALYEKTGVDPDSEGDDILKLIRYFRSGSQELQFVIPDNVSVIGPYAFYGCGENTTILTGQKSSSKLTKICDKAFTNSGLVYPEKPDYESLVEMFGVFRFDDSWTDEDKNGLDYDPEKAFDDFYFFSPYESEGTDDGGSGSDVDSYFDSGGEDDYQYDESDGYNKPRDDDQGVVIDDKDEVKYESLAGDKSQFDESKYTDFLDTHDTFEKWSEKYIKYNRDNHYVDLSDGIVPYTMLYKGEAHYRTMACVLNGDKYKTEYSIKNVGDDYYDMYMMMDHGLFAEIERCRMPDNVILYSGITPERAAQIAGLDKTAKPSTDDLINSIGNYYTDVAMMSTTASVQTAISFSGQSETMVMIYAPKDIIDEVGAINIDCMGSIFMGEEEILLSNNAKYKILDVGKITCNTGVETEERTCIKLEMIGKEQ